MKNIAENNLVRFKNISKTKEGIFANFKVKGVRGGTFFSASISIDISAAEVHPGDPLEKIIEEDAESNSVMLQSFLVVAATRLFFKRAPEMHQILSNLYKQIMKSSLDLDLRQKVVFYYRLL